MLTRTLGTAGPQVNEIGLGCWQFGGDFGPMDESTAESIMDTAIELGVNFFDTANVYGAGQSEQWIGRYLAKKKPSVFVATKYGRGPEAFPDKYTLAGMRDAVTQSLRRLQVDRIDLLQLHCIPTDVLRSGEVFDWLRQLQSEGLIHHFGASVESVEEGLICLKQPGLLSLQVIFNIFRQKLIHELFPSAFEQGIGIIVRLPLASGLLSGRFRAESTFPESDHRNYNRDGQHFNVGETFAGLPFAVGVELTEKLKSIVPSDMSLAELSIRWILDHPAVSVVIPGASSPSQVRSNVKASQYPPLPSSLHEKIHQFYLEQVTQHIRGPY